MMSSCVRNAHARLGARICLPASVVRELWRRAHTPARFPRDRPAARAKLLVLEPRFVASPASRDNGGGERRPRSADYSFAARRVRQRSERRRIQRNRTPRNVVSRRWLAHVCCMRVYVWGNAA